MKVTNKEGIIENSDRKRKKISDNIIAKMTKEEVYTSVVNFEENESKKRSVEKDSELFHQTCEDLRKIFDTVAVAKQKSSSETVKQEISEKRIEGSLLFVLLKKLNRLDKVRYRDNREALQKEKLRVDSNRLQLQNLLYEADHLNKEIQRCYQFKSQDEEINLVSVDEFYENAPSTISRPNKTKTDEHAKRLARLEWELQQRKQLSILYNKLETEKQMVAEDINKKTEKIESLAPRLQSLLKATRPLQEALNMPFEQEWEIQKTSKFLSRPLYLWYVNVYAYISAFGDKNVKITINGDEDEAKQTDVMNNSVEIIEEFNSNSQDSDGDDNEIEYEETSKSHRRLTKAGLREQKIQNLYTSHPLTVTVSIVNKKNSQNSIDLKFTYLTALGFVTVKCDIVRQELTGSAGDILNCNTILNSLIGNDLGDCSPNPKTKYQLNELNIDKEKFHQTLEEKNFGKPYLWAQKMCGLDFVNSLHSSKEETLQDATKMVPEIIKLIRLRWESRVLLQNQIKLFEDNTTDFALTIKSSYSIRISSNLVQCTAISWEEFKNQNKLHENFLEESNVKESDIFYRAVLTRGSAKLECCISIPCNFPTQIALWNLNLNWNGNHNRYNNSAILEMESWINSTFNDVKITHKLLEKQMERALCCLDIYLETEGLTFNPPEFVPEKTFIRPFRGRQRSRPYKILNNNEGCCVFTQIRNS